jgi:hexosaminidase
VADVIPAPVSFEAHESAAPFELTDSSRLVASGKGAAAVAETFAAGARAATGFELPVVQGSAGASDIALVVTDGPTSDGSDEAYTLESSAAGVRIAAVTPAGLFRGTQTLRQLLPPEIERADADGEPDGGWTVLAASVADAPRYAYRGLMLDVTSHFMPVDDVLGLIDAIALLKLNVLHLHLTDDQGWRIQMDSWPELTGIGASTSVGGDAAGFYTKDDYRRIVEFAADRFVTVVPEIDVPGHANAALSAYPELNCDGVAPAPFSGIGSGFSSFCASPETAEATDRFFADVVREVAELTPGPWFHVGGDEAWMSKADYRDLVHRMTQAVAANGKTVIGWHELGASHDLPPGTIGQYWSLVDAGGDPAELTRSFVKQGGQVILSPADVAYLDMRYYENPENSRGHTSGTEWANGPTSIDEAYLWEPTEVVPGIGEEDILGVEAPVWTETMGSMSDVEFMVFPRIAGIAEVAWSPAPDAGTQRDAEGFFERVATFGEHLDQLRITYFEVPEVPWRK